MADTYEQEDARHLTSNSDYVNISALKIRLDTNPTITKVELFLRGYHSMIEQDSMGRMREKRVIVGAPKANDVGIQSILTYLTGVFNTQGVQGNYTEERYENYIMEINIDFSTMLVNNCYKWGIAEDDLDVIIDFVMGLLQPFVSRMIDNKERESYEKSLITHETSRTEEKNKGFFLNPFKRG